MKKALKAQSALRNAAGLEPEQFPLEAFVGMISDEIQILREQGRIRRSDRRAHPATKQNPDQRRRHHRELRIARAAQRQKRLANTTHRLNNSRNRLVCTRLTGISVCFLSFIRS